jgi:hypothetical protein
MATQNDRASHPAGKLPPILCTALSGDTLNRCWRSTARVLRGPGPRRTGETLLSFLGRSRILSKPDRVCYALVVAVCEAGTGSPAGTPTW